MRVLYLENAFYKISTFLTPSFPTYSLLLQLTPHPPFPTITVPDAILLGMLNERLSQVDCVTRGWVLHGYPRSREQAEQLAFAGHVPNRFKCSQTNIAAVEE